MTTSTGGSHPTTRARARGLAVNCAGIGALGLLADRLIGVAVSTWTSVGQNGPAAADDLIAGISATAAVLLIGWFTVAVALSVSAALVGNRCAVGSLLSRAARCVAPAVLRNAVAAAMGIAVVATPMAAQASGMPVLDSRPLSSSAAPVGEDLFSPSWAPAPTPTPSNLAGTANATSDLRPGWIPDQPPKAGRAKPFRSPTLGTAPARHPADRADDVVVRRGDTLWSITARHLGPGATDAEVAQAWPHWFTTNRTVIGADPDRLSPGQRLRPPGSAAHRAGGAGNRSVDR